MEKKGNLEKISSSFKRILLTTMVSSFLFSGCYFNRQKREAIDSYPIVYYNDYDGDGILDNFDPWPYRFGPYVDANHNGYIDFPDYRTRDSFTPFHYPYFYFQYHSHFKKHDWPKSHWNKKYYEDYRKKQRAPKHHKLRNNRGDRNYKDKSRNKIKEKTRFPGYRNPKGSSFKRPPVKQRTPTRKRDSPKKRNSSRRR